MKAAILAGGKGTRLSKLIKDTPKALIKIGKKPVIEHQIILLKKHGINEIWLLLGYLGNQIKEYFQDGKKWDVRFHYCQEKKPLGTAGALKQLKNKIKEDFLVLSGDIMMDFDVKRFISWHKQKKDGIAWIVVHPSDHPFDSDLVETDSFGKIVSLLKRPHRPGINFQNLSIASIFIFSPKIFKYIPSGKKTDFEEDILPSILKAGENVFAYKSPEYIKDMGTPERLVQVKGDYISGKIKKLNLKNKRKAIFLDRDGLINKEIGQLSRIEDLKIYNFAARAIKEINDSDYLAVLITNQPMIAKGFMTEEDLTEIHKKLETELAQKGAKLDAIYYCPHHPEKGFVNEVPELKIKCDCRKPEIGLILEAKKEFNIELKKSYLIGDKTSDILTGKRAGCQTILVRTGYGGRDKLFSVKPDFIVNNLLEAVKLIQKEN